MEVRKGEVIKDGATMTGSRTKVKIVKNKVAPPFKTAEFDLMYGTGISHEGDVADMAVEAGILEKSGSWYSYDNQRICQGRENLKNYLKQNKDVCDEIEAKVRQTLSGKPILTYDGTQDEEFEDFDDDIGIIE